MSPGLSADPMLARAAVARRLIRDGDLDPLLGLAYVVTPTPAILAAEATLDQATFRNRIHHDRAVDRRRVDSPPTGGAARGLTVARRPADEAVAA